MSYRDDSDAIRERVQVLDRETEILRRQNEAIRQHNLMLQRGAVHGRSSDVYRVPTEMLAPAERAVLAHHQIRAPFPVWATAILTVISFGLFPLIHFGIMHDRLPRAAHDDPSAGKAIGFSFIPYYNLYWMFFNSLRLTDRINLQFRLRGLPNAIPRGLVMASCIVSVIPYLNLVSIPILWTISVAFMQSAANRLAGMEPLLDMPEPPRLT